MNQPSFWDVEDMTTPVRVRDTFVGPASTADVTEFCRRYHYTNTGGNMTWRWGLWHGMTMMGVVAYNLPTRPSCEAVFGPEHFDKVWHMGRLSMADTAPHNSESRLIGGSLRAIEANHPEVWAVVTYAATSQGHIGYVYQATNAVYTGITAPHHYYVDRDGRTRPMKQGLNVSTSKALARGWTVHHEGGKHRYLYILGNKRDRRERLSMLRYPVLPYPKGTV